jgi:hypothetical protein
MLVNYKYIPLCSEPYMAASDEITLDTDCFMRLYRKSTFILPQNRPSIGETEFYTNNFIRSGFMFRTYMHKI